MKITIDIDPSQPGSADVLRRLADALEGQQTQPAEAPTVRPIRIDPHTPHVEPCITPHDPHSWPVATGKPWIDPRRLPVRPAIWWYSPGDALALGARS